MLCPRSKVLTINCDTFIRSEGKDPEYFIYIGVTGNIDLLYVPDGTIAVVDVIPFGKSPTIIGTAIVPK